MLKISLSPHHNSLLLNLKEAGHDPAEVARKAVEGTLNYFQVHGTVTFLTSETKDCYGCRFLAQARHTGLTLHTPGRPAKIIPFEPPEPQANGTA